MVEKKGWPVNIRYNRVYRGTGTSGAGIPGGSMNALIHRLDPTIAITRYWMKKLDLKNFINTVVVLAFWVLVTGSQGNRVTE